MRKKRKTERMKKDKKESKKIFIQENHLVQFTIDSLEELISKYLNWNRKENDEFTSCIKSSAINIISLKDKASQYLGRDLSENEIPICTELNNFHDSWEHESRIKLYHQDQQVSIIFDDKNILVENFIKKIQLAQGELFKLISLPYKIRIKNFSLITTT